MKEMMRMIKDTVYFRLEDIQARASENACESKRIVKIAEASNELSSFADELKELSELADKMDKLSDRVFNRYSEDFYSPTDTTVDEDYEF